MTEKIEVPGTGGIDSKYSLEEMNSFSKLFEVWHKEAHSWKVKFRKAKAWLIRNRVMVFSISQSVIYISYIIYQMTH